MKMLQATMVSMDAAMRDAATKLPLRRGVIDDSPAINRQVACGGLLSVQLLDHGPWLLASLK